MSDKISALPSVLAAALTDADVLAIVNGAATKRVALSALRTQINTQGGMLLFAYSTDGYTNVANTTNLTANPNGVALKLERPPAASLPAGAAGQNGLLYIDATNNRLVYYSGGLRYFLPIGTSF